MKLPFNLSLTRRNTSPSLTKKAISLTWARIQDNVVYDVANSPFVYIKQGYKENPLVYSAVEAITKRSKKAKFKLFDITNRTAKKEVPSHPILDLLQRPSVISSKAMFLENCVGYRELTGECFMLKIRPGSGANATRTTQLTTFSPEYIKIVQDKTTGLPVQFEYNDMKIKQTIPAADMIYWRTWDPEGGIRGLSPLIAGRKVLVHSNNAYKANMKLTQNMGPSGILAYPDTYDQTQIDQTQQKYKEKYGGPENYGKIMFANADVKWIQTGFKAEDMQLVQGQLMSLRDICNIYGFSSQILNDPENKTYNNMQEAKRDIILNAVLPVLQEFVDILNLQLIPEFEKADGAKYELEIDRTCFEELRDDQLKQAQTAAEMWWATVNEKRRICGLEALNTPEGDEIYVPANLKGQ
jgi:HK97 family phage portal protein